MKIVVNNTVPTEAPPNVIITNFDNLGYGDAESYGLRGVPPLRPNLLAREGLRLTCFHLAQPLGKTKQGPWELFDYYFGKNKLERIRYRNRKLILPHKAGSLVNALPGKDGYPGKTLSQPAEPALNSLTRDSGENYDLNDQYPEAIIQVMQLAREDMVDDLTQAGRKKLRAAAVVEQPVPGDASQQNAVGNKYPYQARVLQCNTIFS